MLNLNNIYILDNYNLLQYSIYNNSIEFIKYFFSITKNINYQCTKGLTSLHLAINLEYNNICELLLTHNEIDVNIQEYENELPVLHYAIAYNNVNIIKLLLKNKKLNINIQDILGRTAIHHIFENDLNIFNYIFEYDLDFNYNLTNIDGNLPFHNYFENENKF